MTSTIKRAALFTLLLSLILTVLSACTPRNLEECLSEASRAPTEQGVNLAAGACYSKFSKPSKAPPTEPPAKENVITKTRELCYVYWDGTKWEKGKTQGDDFRRFSRDYYGVDVVELGIPSKMADSFNISSKVGDTVSNGSFIQFLNSKWHQVESLCGIR
jgi:hypothetical protein